MEHVEKSQQQQQRLQQRRQQQQHSAGLQIQATSLSGHCSSCTEDPTASASGSTDQCSPRHRDGGQAGKPPSHRHLPPNPPGSGREQDQQLQAAAAVQFEVASQPARRQTRHDEPQAPQPSEPSVTAAGRPATAHSIASRQLEPTAATVCHDDSETHTTRLRSVDSSSDSDGDHAYGSRSRVGFGTAGQPKDRPLSAAKVQARRSRKQEDYHMYNVGSTEQQQQQAPCSGRNHAESTPVALDQTPARRSGGGGTPAVRHDDLDDSDGTDAGGDLRNRLDCVSSSSLKSATSSSLTRPSTVRKLSTGVTLTTEAGGVDSGRSSQNSFAGESDNIDFCLNIVAQEKDKMKAENKRQQRVIEELLIKDQRNQQCIQEMQRTKSEVAGKLLEMSESYYDRTPKQCQERLIGLAEQLSPRLPEQVNADRESSGEDSVAVAGMESSQPRHPPVLVRERHPSSNNSVCGPQEEKGQQQ